MVDPPVRYKGFGRSGEDNPSTGAYGRDHQQDVQDAEKADAGAGL